jgi:hypothetical protein
MALAAFRQRQRIGAWIARGACNRVYLFHPRGPAAEKPADLPVQQAIKTELVINLQKALGIDMPLSLLLRVTETIE